MFGRSLGRVAFGGGGGALGDFQLRITGAAGKLLDGAPIEISRGKIHLRESAVGSEDGIDQADFLEEFGPVDGGDEPHAGDHIADRHVSGGLPLVLRPDRLVGSRSLRCQTPIEPAQRRRHPLVLIAQPLDELNGEGSGQRCAIESLQDRLRRLRGSVADAEQPICQHVCFPARGKAYCDSLGRPPQVLDEHHSQHDRDGPKLTDGQRLNVLIGAHESYQHLEIEAAVRMGDEGPSQSEDAGITLERSLGQLWQLAIKTGRQVAPDIADLGFDHRKIIEQPLGSRRDRPSLANRLADAQIRVAEGRAVSS